MLISELKYHVTSFDLDIHDCLSNQEIKSTVMIQTKLSGTLTVLVVQFQCPIAASLSKPTWIRY